MLEGATQTLCEFAEAPKSLASCAYRSRGACGLVLRGRSFGAARKGTVIAGRPEAVEDCL